MERIKNKMIRTFRNIINLINILKYVEIKNSNNLIYIKFDKNVLIENEKSMMIFSKGFFHNIAKIVNLNPDKKYASKQDHCEMFKENPEYYDIDTIRSILDKFGINVSEEKIKELINEEDIVKRLIEENRDKIDIEKLSKNIEKVSIGEHK